MTSNKGIGKSLLCLAILTILPWVLFWEITLLQKVFAEGDVFSYNYPLLHLVAKYLKEGRPPLWNPFLFSGTPLLAQMQSAATYPLNIALLLLPLPTWVAMHYSLLLHYSLAGIFTYLYLRSLRVRHLGAMTAGVTYMFSGFMMSHLGHVSIMRTAVWLPLILFSIERWREGWNPLYLSLGVIAFGLMVTAGHAQIPVYSTMITLCYLLFFAVVEKAARGKLLLGGTLILALGGMVGATQVLSTLEVVSGYAREHSYEFFSSYSFKPWYLFNLLFPHLPRYLDLSELTGYVGILPLLFAFYAILCRRDRITRFFSVLAGVALILIFGKYTPLYRIMYHVPIYNLFQVPARNWFEFDFAFAVLAGLGVDMAFAKDRSLLKKFSAYGQTAVTTLGVIVVSTVGIVLLVSPQIPSLPTTGELLNIVGTLRLTDREVQLPLIFLLLSIVLVSALIHNHRQWYVGVGMLALIIADLFSFGGAIYGLYPPSAYTVTPPSIDFLKKDPSFFRVMTYVPLYPRNEERIGIAYPNLNAVYGISSINGHDGLSPQSYSVFTGYLLNNQGPTRNPELLNPRNNLILDLVNCKYILISRFLNEPTRQVVNGVGFSYDYPGNITLGQEGKRVLAFDVSPYPVTHLGIISALGNSMEVPEGEDIAEVIVTDQTGDEYAWHLKAGRDTSEWAYDNPEVEPFIRHKKATIARDFPVEDSKGNVYQGHFYFSQLDFGKPLSVRRVVFESLLDEETLRLIGLSLFDSRSQRSYPIPIVQHYLADSENYRLVYFDDMVSIYQNLDPLPRTFLVPQIRLVSNAEEVRKIIFEERTFNPQEVALVESMTPIKLHLTEHVTTEYEASVSIVSYEPGAVQQMEVNAPHDEFLVFTENYFPGWKAILDGKPTEIYRTDGAFCGIVVPQGKHKVTFVYDPLSFKLGLVVSIVGWLLTIGMALGTLFQSKG